VTVSDEDTPRVVLDTNVFVAAGFNKGSHSAEIIRRIEKGEWTLVWSEETRRETFAVLEQIPPLDADQFGALFQAHGRYTGETDADAYDAVPDADDRKFAALAAAADAILVSNDDDLIGVRNRLDVETLTPTEVMERYG
jgi:predicted nucleic acid-binding protein